MLYRIRKYFKGPTIQSPYNAAPLCQASPGALLFIYQFISHE